MRTFIIGGNPVVLLDWCDIDDCIKEELEVTFPEGCFNCHEYPSFLVVEKTGFTYPWCGGGCIKEGVPF